MKTAFINHLYKECCLKTKNQHWAQSLILMVFLSILSFAFDHKNAFADFRYTSFNSNYTNDHRIDFSLAFSRTDIDIESSNTSYSVSQTRISAIFGNNISPNLGIGLIVGSSYINLDNDPATSGFSLNGNHIGLSVNQIFGNDIQIAVKASYLYQQTRGENYLRSVTLSWHEWQAEADLRLRLGTHWAFIAGAGYIDIDTDRRIRGDINETVRLRTENNIQRKIAIELLTSPDDRIRLTVKRGALNNTQLNFEHTF